MGGTVQDKQGNEVEIVEGFKSNRAFQNLEADKVGNNYVLQVGPWDNENVMIIVPNYEKNVKINSEGKEIVKLSALMDYQINKPIVESKPIPSFITAETNRWKDQNLLNLNIQLSYLFMQPTLLSRNQSMGLLEKTRFIPEVNMFESSVDLNNKKTHTDSIFIYPSEYKPNESLQINMGMIGIYDFNVSFERSNEINIIAKTLSLDSIKVLLKKK